jgi:hypothetical protein
MIMQIIIDDKEYSTVKSHDGEEVSKCKIVQSRSKSTEEEIMRELQTILDFLL